MNQPSSPSPASAASNSAHRLANGLGLFSIGLGLAEVLAPGRVAKLVGMAPHLGLIRAMGIRELGSGAGLLSRRAADRWAWSRVGGDLVDLAMLGAAARASSISRSRLALAAAAVAGVAALDVYCSRRLGRNGRSRPPHHTQHFNTSITVDRPAEDLYRAWRRFEDLPRFMSHLESVEQTGDHVWHWRAKGPARSRVEWDAEIIEDLPGKRIVWRALENSQVPNSGSVRFEPAPEGRGTEVTLNLVYQPPAGKLRTWIARAFGRSPELQIPVDLHRFKQWMEAGEIATTEGQPAGRPSSLSGLDALIQH